MPGPRRSAPVSLGLGVVLAATLLTLAAGYLLKLPCLTGPWDGRQYTRLCYSDVAALYAKEGIDRGLVPYLEAENEYPVLTGYSMALAGLPARSFVSFFNWTAALLTAAALVTSWALWRIAGARALLFAAAPTLAVYGFMNWDLIAVALATAAVLAFLRDRDGLAGLLIGLGVAAKLYPALLLVPFAAQRAGERRPRRALVLAGWAAGAWLAVNLPVMLLAPARWSLFFRFNSERPADWDSLWFLAERHLGVPEGAAAVNVLAAVSFAAVAAAAWVAARRPADGLWALGFPLILAFLLTSKVYSPQFGLWLLPWFALARIDVRLFAAFQAADLAVFVTRFQFFARLEGDGGVPFEAFEVAILSRAAVLVACLIAWIRERERGGAPEPAAVTA